MFGGIFSGLNLFGNAPPKKSIEEQGKEWNRTLRKEQSRIDRSISGLQMDVKKTTKEAKSLAKKGHTKASKIYVKSICDLKRAITKMHVSKTQLNTIMSDLQTCISMKKVQDILGTSTQIYHEMNELARDPEMRNTMVGMSKELMKAGIIERALDDAFESMEPDDIEEEIDEEQRKLYDQIAAEIFSGASAPTSTPNITPNVAVQEEGMDPEELARIRARVDNL